MQNEIIKTKSRESRVGGGTCVSSCGEGVRNPSVSSALHRNNSKHLSE